MELEEAVSLFIESDNPAEVIPESFLFDLEFYNAFFEKTEELTSDEAKIEIAKCYKAAVAKYGRIDKDMEIWSWIIIDEWCDPVEMLQYLAEKDALPPARLRGDKDFWRGLLEHSELCLYGMPKYATEDIRNDKEFAYDVIKKLAENSKENRCFFPNSIWEAFPSLKGDLDTVRYIVSFEPQYDHLEVEEELYSDELLAKKEFWLSDLVYRMSPEVMPYVVCRAPEFIKDDMKEEGLKDEDVSTFLRLAKAYADACYDEPINDARTYSIENLLDWYGLKNSKWTSDPRFCKELLEISHDFFMYQSFHGTAAQNASIIARAHELCAEDGTEWGWYDWSEQEYDCEDYYGDPVYVKSIELDTIKTAEDIIKTADPIKGVNWDEADEILGAIDVDEEGKHIVQANLECRDIDPSNGEENRSRFPSREEINKDPGMHHAIIDFGGGELNFVIEKNYSEVSDDVKEYLLDKKYTTVFDDVIVDYKIKLGNRTRFAEGEYRDYDFVRQNLVIEVDKSFTSFGPYLEGFEDAPQILVKFHGTVKEWLRIKYSQGFKDKSLLVLCEDGTVQPVKIDHYQAIDSTLVNCSDIHILCLCGTYTFTCRGFDGYGTYQIVEQNSGNYWVFLYYLQDFIVYSKGMGIFNTDIVVDKYGVFDALDYYNFRAINNFDWCT